jgi:predicted O-linked N-acetylglucosamine transferase (SPINDLY family)
LSFNNTKAFRDVTNLIQNFEYKQAKELLDQNKDQFLNDGLFFSLLGYLYDCENNYVEAEKNYLKAVDIDQDLLDAKLNLAILYLKIKNLNRSEFFFNQILDKTKNFLVFYNFGLLQAEKKDYNKAISYFEKSYTLNNNFLPAQHHLAMTYTEIKDYNLAVATYEKLLKTNDVKDINLGVIYNNLGNVYSSLKKFDLAYNYLLKALRYSIDKSRIYNNLGYLCYQIGDLEKSILYFKKATEKNDENLNYHSRLIATSLYSFNHKNLYSNYINKFNLTLEKLKFNSSQNNNSFSFDKFESKLKIGFLSSDFKRHPVGYFLLDHLDNIKKFGLELHGYSNLEERFNDDYTKKISNKFNYWSNIKLLNDRDLVSKIKKDKINILMDLSGHTGDNRIGVFALRAAPIQINWAAYLASLGIKEIDYILGDTVVTPLSHQHKYSENILQLKQIWSCLSVSDLKNLKVVNKTPAINNKYITFGSFSNANKINKKVLNVWLKILNNVPNSKLFLKSFEFEITSQVARIKSFFIKNNINSNRILIEKPSDRLELLNSYNNIDIVLDTFPYSGGTTNFEASWMCVPILTLKGDYFVSKCGESINSILNMKEWIAYDIDNYVNKSIVFSKDFSILNQIKNKLILHSRNSALFNSEEFSLDFSEILKTTWKKFISNNN